MQKIIKLTETDLENILKKILEEGNFYPPLSKDEIIRKLIPFEDKLHLVDLINNREKDSILKKMEEIINKVVSNEKIGEKHRNYVTDYLKRMVGKMIMNRTDN